ncbi:unnamed protein product [Owenia fusiformis]|uniref:Uncharacterized protein n=1 Tax=Owenia fusiformis TaxID=6347 RepID=A0A8J1TD14_OWEFU|nr:unnamed protein product [Owenia fusiformis]
MIKMARFAIVEWAKLESQKVLMNNETLKILIDKKEVDINAADQYGHSALIYTVRNNATNCAKLLLDHGADVNAVNNNGKTALMYAGSVNDSVECANLLIAYGANIDARDNDGATALIHAKSKCMCLLVDKGADVNASNIRGLTALMRSTRFDTIAPMEALLGHGADVNACINPGMNALFYAVCYDNPDSVRLLIKKGADVNKPDLNGDTVLMRSVFNSANPACLVLLLANGADTNAVNHNGKTAMSFAFGMEIYAAICILALYGAPFVTEQLIAIKKHITKGKHPQLELILENLKRPNLQRQARRRIHQQTTRVCRNTKYSNTIDALVKAGDLPMRSRSFMLFEDDIEEIIATLTNCDLGWAERHNFLTVFTLDQTNQ